MRNGIEWLFGLDFILLKITQLTRKAPLTAAEHDTHNLIKLYMFLKSLEEVRFALTDARDELLRSVLTVRRRDRNL
jgi:hypothetical protein